MNATLTAAEAFVGWITYLAVEAWQASNRFFDDLISPTWEAGGNQYYAILIGDTQPAADTDSTLADFGTGGNENAVFTDAADWINTGDGAPINVTARVADQLAGATRIQWGDLNFGSNLTIQGVAEVGIFAGDFTNPLSTDAFQGYADLEDGDLVLSVSSGVLNVQAPANNTWFQVNAQA